MDIRISDLIVENNHQFVIVNKPAGVPVQDDKTGDLSLTAMMQGYTKVKLHLHTRLDRPVSGLVLFSKQKNSRLQLIKQQETGTLKKTYLAAVTGKLEIDDELEHFHIKDAKLKKAHISNEMQKGYRQVKLYIKSLVHLDNYTIVKLQFNTGAFHQLRAQLAFIGHPIKGDVKYGARRKNQDRGIHLHAHSIEFLHPVSQKKLLFNAMPDNNDPIWKALSLE